MLKDVTCTLVAHPSEDGQRVRVSGITPRPFDVMPSNTLMAVLKNHGIEAPPDRIVLRLIGEDANLATGWAREAALMRRAEPDRFPTFKVNTNSSRAVNAILSAYGKPIL